MGARWIEKSARANPGDPGRARVRDSGGASTALAEEATLVAVGAGDTVSARVGESGPADVLEAVVLATAGFRPCVGDRVLLVRGARMAYVVGALVSRGAEVPRELVLGDGARATLDAGALELRDVEGHLLLRYEGGAVEVTAPTADLKLAAPRGRVVIEAATDVTIAAARDLVHQAGRRVDVAVGDPSAPPRLRVEPERTRVVAEHVSVEARKGTVAIGEATIIARTIATTAESVAQNVERYELTAKKLVENAREAVRNVEGLLEQRIGRARLFVTDAFSLATRRTSLESEEETSIDGKKILIG